LSVMRLAALEKCAEPMAKTSHLSRAINSAD
jgi:hypothetical protein